MAKVFYIDDDKTPLEIIPALFQGGDGEPLEFTTMLAKKGVTDDAVKQAMDSDIVVADYNWRIGRSENGIEFAKKLRDAGYKKPIIIYSADSGEDIKLSHNGVDALGVSFANKSDDNPTDKLHALIQESLKSPPNIGEGARGAG